MQIIIPMSGVGRRFIEAGYKDVKPLIRVDGKPIIEHVVNLFPKEHNFIFICNEEHLRNTPMRKILKSIAPKGKIVSIAPHKKGPVYAVSQVFDLIDDKSEVIVNYCDFSKNWNYPDFLKHTRQRKADGAISAYRGFHPHMLGSTNYAFMLDDKQWMKDIQEKKPFTSNRMNEFASDGTYYFRRGELVKKYFQRTLDCGPELNGEYYVSLVYKHMIADRLKISIYEIEHMLQWGEPGHLEEYQQWSDCFRQLIKKPKTLKAPKNSVNLIPMAGRGKRFADEGYKNPKPLIDISAKPMIIQALSHFPSAEKQTFVCLAEHLKQFPLAKTIKKEYPKAQMIALDRVTEGQACTCEIGLADVDPEASLFIGACDNGMLWDREEYNKLLLDKNVDCIVWSFRQHPASARNPKMYGWIKVDDEDNILNVSVKVPISEKPFNDHAIIGAFYFRRAGDFLKALKELYRKNIRVNNEFYVDSVINEIIALRLNAKVFCVDHYICWGTPNDLRTFEYWQNFFDQCAWHPYKLAKDPMVDKSKVKQLQNKYSLFKQKHS